MDVLIASDALGAIVAEAARTPEREVCGLLLGASTTAVRPEPVEGRVAGAVDRSTSPSTALQALRTGFDFARDERGDGKRSSALRIAMARATPNVATDPARAFEIDPASLFAAIRAARGGGPPVLGHYHSHSNGSPVPSACDAAMADRPGRLWLIVARGEARLWRERPGGPVQNAFEPVRLVVDRATSGCA